MVVVVLLCRRGPVCACCLLRQGEPGDTLPQLVSRCGAGLLVTDYSPLRLGRTWKQQVGGRRGAGTAHSTQHDRLSHWQVEWDVVRRPGA